MVFGTPRRRARVERVEAVASARQIIFGFIFVPVAAALIVFACWLLS